MEQQVWSLCKQSLETDKPLPLQSLASMRSLIVNPHTSNSTISSILETLIRSLKFNTDSDLLTLHHTLKLLTDLASHRTDLSPLIFNSVHSNSLLSTDSTLLATESLVALFSISESSYQKLPIQLDDRFFVSLCFGPLVSVRMWLLKNAERFGMRPFVLFTVFLGFTKDPYPYVRKEALDGLVRLCKYGDFENQSLIEGCYYRGVELLRDAEDCVRSAAVRVVSEWGQMLMAVTQEEDKGDWSNTIFLQFCSVVRDMSTGVRIEAFNAIGKIQMPSEDILLQTLSKKVLSVTKEKKSHSLQTAERLEILLASAAGAFIHGLEDEFYEVRKSACCSLRKLIVLSTEFSGWALNLLMDMLNDNSLAVRLEALETLHHMATSGNLNVQEIHMHMFLGTLIDNNDLIRSAARKIFKLVKLPCLELFRVSVDGLLENLEIYPQDEVDVFSVMFCMGRNHGNFAACIIKEVSQEIEPVSNGTMGLDSARVAAFLVLSISAPLSCDQISESIPPRFFSYAVTLLGRISSALNDIMDQNSLLEYLSQCSRSSISSGMDIEGEEPLLPVVNADVATHAVAMPILQIGDDVISYETGDFRTLPRECQLKEHDHIQESVNLILTNVKDIWLLVQSRSTREALNALRTFKKELAMFAPALPESAGVLAFTLQYLQVIKLLAKLWGHIFWKVQSYETGKMEILLGKLERMLREMRCRFIGFSREEESHILELIIVACILRLPKVGTCCYLATLKKLSTTISHLELLLKEGSIELSYFIMEVKKTLPEIGTSTSVSCSPLGFMKLIHHYSVKQFSLCGVRHLHATLDVPDNDSENPLPFVSGLPVALPLEITLHNVASDSRLWLRMTMNEELVQFVFLDFNILQGWDEVKKFKFAAPFYRTPKASSFTLRVCIGMECLFEDVHLVKSHGGPHRTLVYICPEKEVFLYMV